MTAKIAVLISGNGSNLQAIIDAIKVDVLTAEIIVVVSNRESAFGLERAATEGIPTRVHLLKPYRDSGRSREEYDADLADIMAEYDPEWIIMAGWMHILSNAFLQKYPYAVINLHPALPGMFPGATAIQEAYDAYQVGEIDRTGIMVHLVPDEKVDAGPVVATSEVPIYQSDTLEMLTNRMHQNEHKLLVQALIRLIEGDEDQG